MAWQYTLSVRVADERMPHVVTEMLLVQDVENGVKIFSKEAIDEQERELIKAKEEAEQKQRDRQKIEDKFDTMEKKPVPKWRGPHNKWCVMAYDQVVEIGFATKEAAQAQINSGRFNDSIAHYRAMFIDQENRKAA